MAWPMVEQFWRLEKSRSSGNYSPQHDKKSFLKVLHNQLISEMKNAGWINLPNLGRTMTPIAFCNYLFASLFPSVQRTSKSIASYICTDAFLLEKAQISEFSFPLSLLNPVNFQLQDLFIFYAQFLIKYSRSMFGSRFVWGLSYKSKFYLSALLFANFQQSFLQSTTMGVIVPYPFYNFN